MNENLIPLQTAPLLTAAQSPSSGTENGAESGEQAFPTLFASVVDTQNNNQPIENADVFSAIPVFVENPGDRPADPDGLDLGRPGQAMSQVLDGLPGSTSRSKTDDLNAEDEAMDGNMLPVSLPLTVQQQTARAVSAQQHEPMATPLAPALKKTGLLQAEDTRTRRTLSTSGVHGNGTRAAVTGLQTFGEILPLSGDENAAVQSSLLVRTSITDRDGHRTDGRVIHADSGRDALQVNGGDWRGQAAQVRTSADPGDRSAIPELRMERQLGTQGWNTELGNRIVWMARNDQQQARIRINPPHMGPIEVRVSVHQDSANIVFSAHNTHAREAIEAAIPRLREMMAEQGFGTTQVDVSGHGTSQGQERQAGRGSEITQMPGQGPGFDDAEDHDQDTTGVIVSALPDDGIVDYFV